MRNNSGRKKILILGNRKVYNCIVTIFCMGRGYSEESKMGRALDVLLTKGIDCIKIIPPKNIADETVFLALGIDEGGVSYEGLCKICKSTHIEGMEIFPVRKTGEYIKNKMVLRGLEPDPKYRGLKLKIEAGKLYNLVGIRYIPAEVGTKASTKQDVSYLNPNYRY
jgi:hypothetical protein